MKCTRNEWEALMTKEKEREQHIAGGWVGGWPIILGYDDWKICPADGIQ